MGASVRFVCHVPLLVYAVISLYYFSVIVSRAKALTAPPLDARVLAAQATAGFTGALGFIWNVLTYERAKEGQSVQLMWGDGAIALVLAVVSGLQGSYIALTPKECGRVGQHESFRAVLFERLRDGGDRVNWYACEMHLAMWALGIAILGIYFLSAFLTFITVYVDKRHSDVGFYIFLVFSPTAVALFALDIALRVVCTTIFAIIPTFARAYIIALSRWPGKALKEARSSRFGLQYLTTRLRHCWGKSPDEPPPDEKGAGKGDEAAAAASPVPTSEVHFVNRLPYDVLVLISSYLHYTDMISLSRTSRQMRAAFPIEDPPGLLSRHMEVQACGGSVLTCWSCSVPICRGCSHVRHARIPPIRLHARVCRPVCPTCYITRVRKHCGATGRRCRCADERRRRGVGRGDWAAPRPDDRLAVGRLVCWACAALGTDAFRERRERIDRSEYSMEAAGARCLKCKGAVPGRGGRWWACSTCGGECWEGGAHWEWGKELGV